MPLCAAKPCDVRPVFVRVAGELWAANQANVQGSMKQNASLGAQSEAPSRRWRPGQEQRTEQENQVDSAHLNQPGGSFPDANSFKTIV